jgi:hypothetical protein
MGTKGVIIFFLEMEHPKTIKIQMPEIMADLKNNRMLIINYASMVKMFNCIMIAYNVCDFVQNRLKKK